MQCVAIQHPAGTASVSGITVRSLVAFIARASEHIKPKKFQHMSAALGSGFFPCFHLGESRAWTWWEIFWVTHNCSVVRSGAGPVFNLCAWALKWTFIPQTGLPCVHCPWSWINLFMKQLSLNLFQGLYCFFFKSRAAYVLLRCFVYLKIYWIWSCVHGSHTYSTPFPCLSFQCCIFPVWLISVPCSYHNTHGVSTG